jgi:hypothetical protein
MRAAISALVLPLALSAAGQGFQLQFGGSNLQDAVATVADANGYTTLVRETFPTGDKVRIRVLRTNLSGQDQQWFDVALGGACFVQAAISAGDGNILVCGSRIAPGRSDQDALLAKISTTGTILWSWTSGTPQTQEELRGMVQLADGGVAACGAWRDTADSDALLVRTDASGNLLWQQHYGTTDEETTSGIAFDTGGFLLAGSILGPAGDRDAYILRTDLAGNEQWWQGWGGIKDDVLKSVVHRTADFVMAGYTDSYGPMQGAQHVRSVYLMAMNVAGDTLWTRTLGDVAQAGMAEDIHVATNGDLLLAGQAGSQHATDAMVLRTDGNGDQLWKRTYDLAQEDLLHGVSLLPDGGFIASGRAFGPNGMQAALVRKNSNGN